MTHKDKELVIARLEEYKGDSLGLIAATIEDCQRVVGEMKEDGWISVTEQLPENEVDVLICAERRLYGIAGGERKTVRVIAAAFHTDGKMNTEDSGYNWELDNVDMEYDEEADAYIVPEGWWEVVRYGEEFSAVDDFVTHWMPLPGLPREGAV